MPEFQTDSPSTLNPTSAQISDFLSDSSIDINLSDDSSLLLTSLSATDFTNPQSPAPQTSPTEKGSESSNPSASQSLESSGLDTEELIMLLAWVVGSIVIIVAIGLICFCVCRKRPESSSIETSVDNVDQGLNESVKDELPIEVPHRKFEDGTKDMSDDEAVKGSGGLPEDLLLALSSSGNPTGREDDESV
jgi:hypothetical protein